MIRFARTHPFLCLGVISLLMLYVPSALGFQYDEGGVKGVLVILGYAVGSVFRWAYLLLFSIAGGSGFAGIKALSVLVALGPYVAADQALAAWRRARKPAAGDAGVNQE